MQRIRLETFRQSGVSLVEIMVAMVIGLIILLAVTQVLVNSSRTRGEVERTGRQIENGTFALQLFKDELSNAGFWGEAGVQEAGAVLPSLCPSDQTGLEGGIGYPVQGSTDASPGCATSVKADSDLIAIRRASSCSVGTTGCAASNASMYYLQTQACGDAAGDLDLQLGVAGFAGQDRACTGPAPIYRYLSRVYYLTDNDELARMELGEGSYGSSGALVDGIEMLRFSYGLDSDGDGEVDAYESAPAGSEWADVVAVRIWLVARNLTPSTDYQDGNTYSLGEVEYEVPDEYRSHKRQVYSTTVHLRNISGTREVQ